MMKMYHKFGLVVAGAPALALSGLEASAHPGSHIGADHSHFFGGGEVLILVALAAAAAMFLHNRKG